jgi:hypothetical protein
MVISRGREMASLSIKHAPGALCLAPLSNTVAWSISPCRVNYALAAVPRLRTFLCDVLAGQDNRLYGATSDSFTSAYLQPGGHMPKAYDDESEFTIEPARELVRLSRYGRIANLARH